MTMVFALSPEVQPLPLSRGFGESKELVPGHRASGFLWSTVSLHIAGPFFKAIFLVGRGSTCLLREVLRIFFVELHVSRALQS